MDVKITSGCEVIDELIGGVENNLITAIYGPAGSGKSNFCLLFANQIAKNKKVIYIDTEGGFSIERFKQINPNYEDLLNNIIILKPTNFAEQRKAVRILKEIVNESIGVIIVDTISMLYRAEIASQEELYSTNKELGKQIVLLTEIARKNNIPVIITNQVYSNFKSPGEVEMVGGDLLKYGSKCLLEIKKGRNSIRKLIVRKHRSIPEEKEITFRIVESGFELIGENKSNILDGNQESKKENEQKDYL